MYKESKELIFKPQGNSKGFRRFIWPRYLKAKKSEYPAEMDYSEEQYLLAKKVSTKEFFNQIQGQLKSIDESTEDEIKRKVKSICGQIQDRVTEVNEARQFLKSKQRNYCMTYTQFDTYSTPMRDKELKESFESLKFTVKRAIASKKLKSISKEFKEVIVDLFSKKIKKNIKSYCEFKINDQKTLSISQVYKRMKKGLISSDPHQPAAARWGEATPIETGCKVFYE